ncbi:MAG TPA: hypothetical protein VNV87_00320 [Acidimicrobiales bacterium]|nr:hypothetical protein [Acidimicrobiales bacterium]
MADVGIEMREILSEEGAAGAWRRLLDFVDDFRGSSAAGQGWLVEVAPPRCGDMGFDAAMAAVADGMDLLEEVYPGHALEPRTQFLLEEMFGPA